MMSKIWRKGNELVLRTQVQLQEGLRALPTVRARRKGQEGATMVEYAILVALIAVAVIATVILVGEEIDKVFNKVVDEMAKVTTG
ncbi:Flp family type IVb pilin [Desulfurivibrio sp. C05AmB]|uniref:Flp family type IVb pilin n=1 Tax=Desulfurivibrio sp. C05AmB TaxID=3374371 RepID=UPI00376F2425